MSDSSGNEAATVSRKVTVVKDSVPPTISLNGDSTVTVLLNQTFVDPGASAFDIVSAIQSFLLFIFTHIHTHI